MPDKEYPNKLSSNENKLAELNLKDYHINKKNSMKPLDHLKIDRYSNYESKTKTEGM
jgi:hypothetical protein